MSNDKLKNRQARLFSTLASIEQTDRSATKRRKQSHLQSLRQSRAAADQTKLSGILLELRILTQRCLAESAVDLNDNNKNDSTSVNGHANGVDGKSADDSRVQDEVDALLENLLVARRELMGHQLDNNGRNSSVESDDTSSADGEEKKKGVDYEKLIQQQTENNGESSSDDEDDSSSNDDDTDSNSSSGSSDNNSNLAKQLQNEYTSLRDHCKSVLNKHHSNLALHSGMSVNSSKFQSRAVDVSFWEQVQGGMEHERFKQRTSANDNQIEGNGSCNSSAEQIQFDDSKLYQQMLKDFISSSQTNGTTTNKRGMMIDPSQEAAERLKRAVRKKSGGNATGDIDLTSLLTETGMTTNSDGILSTQNAAIKKKASTVDRRASKGRKIRYTVNSKLVNFTFPVGRPEPMIKEDVWFKSLFGVGNLK